MFDPKEFKEACDGWELYKKSKFNFQPVRRYISMVQEDYTRNKIWVCAYLSNLFNSYQVSKLYRKSSQTMEKTNLQVNNYFDYDKWLLMYDPQAQEAFD